MTMEKDQMLNQNLMDKMKKEANKLLKKDFKSDHKAAKKDIKTRFKGYKELLDKNTKERANAHPKKVILCGEFVRLLPFF